MATSKRSLHDAIRAKYIALVSAFLAAQGEEVLTTGSNEISLPCVDSEGNDEYLVITFKVPTGERSGEPYDGHLAAKDYADHLAAKKRKAKEAAEKKAKKIAADKAAREAKAKAKAEREGA